MSIQMTNTEKQPAGTPITCSEQNYGYQTCAMAEDQKKHSSSDLVIILKNNKLPRAEKDK